MKIIELRLIIRELISELQETLANFILIQGKEIYEKGNCQILNQSSYQFEFLVEGHEEYIELIIDTEIEESDFHDETKEKVVSIYPRGNEWDKHSFACLLQMEELLNVLDPDRNIDHKQYSREGMIQRVLAERRQKALHAEYRIKWADNIYGDHILTNENGVKYKIFLRDFDMEIGYSNSKDSIVNKLGTTKHIMFAFNQLKGNQNLYKRLKKQCPFVEVYCNPLNNYAIHYFYPNELPAEIAPIFSKYFNTQGFVEETNISKLNNFFNEAQFFDTIVIRPEVKEKVSDFFEAHALESLRKKYIPDYSQIKANLYNYQCEGISFGTCRKHAIIADEMGLGKTIQAIGISILKKDVFGFKKTLVVCPASLKAQWKKEIEKFSNEKALVVQGTPDERAVQYNSSDAYFIIVNYETVLRDQIALNKAKIDFLILDEAQKVKNYATKTASAIKNVGRKHVLIITGTPIENRLIDLFSIMTILDPHLLGPLWEFSYQYCLFDKTKPNKINAYYNLNSLKELLIPILIRREKRKVLEQLPNIQQQDVPVGMTPLQADYHASYASGIGQIINKKFLTAFDMQRLQQLLTSMRMVCDSTFLVDEATSDSPKLEELKYILLDKLDLKNQFRKVIIFSEWVKVHKLIGQMLLENGIAYTELNGSVPVKKRGDLIKTFEENENCKVFLSTEAGGSGLNLQVADILINFELPWNPAKKNQRIGRIDRLGQKSDKLTIFNLITINSIEQRIALGLLVKQNLFDSVLNESSNNDFVDFTEKGRGQFLQQMKELANEFDEKELVIENTEEESEDLIIKENAKEDFIKENAEDNLEPFSEDDSESSVVPEISEVVNKTEPVGEEIDSVSESETSITNTAVQMEEVMNNGMQFLSGLMQMATGKSIGIENQKIEINKETGEVIMKFKLPV